MNLLVKRRQLIMAALVVVLGAAVFVNWYYTQPKASDSGMTTSDYVQNLGEAQLVGGTSKAGKNAGEYFAQIKLNRQNAHEDAMDNINAVLDGAAVDSPLAENVAQSLDELNASIELESSVETLVSAKLGCDCVAVCGEGTMQVVVEKGILSDAAALQIRDIVLQNSKIPADKITIVEAG